jgi:Uma2 family endonuclease
MLQTPRRKRIVIGPEDDGRRMSLDDFDSAIAREGHQYELGKGVIEVSEVPGPSHLAQLEELKTQFYAYKISNKGIIYAIASSNEAKILVASVESERHPDLCIYLQPPPEVDIWSSWIPTIVIEVVSASSRKRDFEEKPDEYLEFGVDEYWIIDAMKRQMTVLKRWRGQWKRQIVKPPRKYSTNWFPGFALDLRRVFAAAAAPKGKSRNGK